MYGVFPWFESPIQPAVTFPLRPRAGLQGMGSANQLAVDMPDQTVKIFYAITTDLDAALTAGGRPQRPYNFAAYNTQTPVWGLAPNGYYTVTQFDGGWLLDNCPLNVIFGTGWLPGQQAALQAGGLTANCAQATGQSYATPTPPSVLTTQATPISAPVVPQSAAPVSPLNAATYTPPQAPVFTTTSSGSGIVSYPTPVVSPSGTGTAAIPLPTGGPTTISEPPIEQPVPDWTPYIAAGVLAVILLSRR